MVDLRDSQFSANDKSNMAVLNFCTFELISRHYSFCQSTIEFRRFQMYYLDWNCYFWYFLRVL